jgi:hypothetical protein
MTKRTAEAQKKGQTAPRKSAGEPKSEKANSEVGLTKHQLKKVSGGVIAII